MLVNLTLTHTFRHVYCLQKLRKMCHTLADMYNNDGQEFWQPCEELLTILKCDYTMMILNVPIKVNMDPTSFLNLWNQAKLRITVDKGTERWLDWLEENRIDPKDAIPPELITGDLDSISTKVLDFFYDSGNTDIIPTPDQSETDYTKAFRTLKVYSTDKSIKFDRVYVVADTVGRCDQILGNINTLFKARNIFTNVKIYQIASDSITWLLSTGNHKISVPTSLRKHEEWCALIPIGSTSVVTTTGLKWNLDNTKLAFGHLVSTSNTYDGSPYVTVNTDNPLVWSMGIDNLFNL